MKKISLIITIILAITLLAGCAEVDLSQPSQEVSTFQGTQGEFIAISGDEIRLDASSVDDGSAHYFNTTLPNGNPVFFFVVKSPDGKLRAAANGCQVCGKSLQGFRQEGDYMVCNTCGNSYPLNKIATEKGGCNPAPINPNLEIENGQIFLSLSELESIEQFFK